MRKIFSGGFFFVFKSNFGHSLLSLVYMMIQFSSSEFRLGSLTNQVLIEVEATWLDPRVRLGEVRWIRVGSGRVNGLGWVRVGLGRGNG